MMSLNAQRLEIIEALFFFACLSLVRQLPKNDMKQPSLELLLWKLACSLYEEMWYFELGWRLKMRTTAWMA